METDIQQTQETLDADAQEDKKEAEALDPEVSDPAEAAETAESAEAAETAESAEAANAEESDDVSNNTPAKRSIFKKTLIVLAAVLALVIAGCCVALAADDSARTQRVPEKTTLDGQINVSGMTEDELRAAIDSRAESGSSSIVLLNVKNEVFEINLLEVGALDLDASVAQAYAPYNTGIIARWSSRIIELATGETANYSINTVFNVDHDALVSRVTDIANETRVEMVNAGYKFDDASRLLVAVTAVEGEDVDVDATVSAIESTVAAGPESSASRRAVQAPINITAPEKTDPGQAIFVDTRTCRLRLYENGAEVANYACTPGQSGYETPKGDFYLDYKDPSPVWINPHSDWSASMPETIEPGASNPLGLRALAVSCGGGIFIHGTTSVGELGSRGSHGCVRLSNANIVELYDRVLEGIPIIIR